MRYTGNGKMEPRWSVNPLVTTSLAEVNETKQQLKDDSLVIVKFMKQS